jgi:dihydrofolate reductase
MRKVIALVFHYSVNGLLADEGTDYLRFCFQLLEEAGGASSDDESLDFLQGAYAHVMGRTAYEGMSKSLPANPDHPWSGILTAGRKVVFSRTLETADWDSTTIASGDTTEEVDKLRQGGDGHIIVWGGVSLWRSLMQLDLVDEWHLGLHPYIADEGTRLFDDVPKGYRLDLISNTALQKTGILELQYGRRR